MDCLVQKGRQANKGFLVLKENREVQGTKAYLEAQAILVKEGHKASEAHWDKKERRVEEVYLESQA